jgi:hypothetical protein
VDDRDQIRALGQLARELNLAETRLRTYQLAARYISEVLEADRASLAIATSAGLVISGLNRDFPLLPLGSAISPERSGLGEVFSSGQARRWAPMSEDLVDQADLARLGVRCSMAAPLVTSEGVIGTLQTGRMIDRPFTDSDLAMLEHVALLVAGALQRVELIDQLEARSAEAAALPATLAALAGASDRLATTGDLDAIRGAALASFSELYQPQRSALLWREAEGTWRDLVSDTPLDAADIPRCASALENREAVVLSSLGERRDRILSRLFDGGAAVAAAAGSQGGALALVAVAGSPSRLQLAEPELLAVFTRLVACAARSAAGGPGAEERL